MIREAVEKIVGGQNLTFEEAKTVMNEIMSGKTSETMISAYPVSYTHLDVYKRQPPIIPINFVMSVGM